MAELSRRAAAVALGIGGICGTLIACSLTTDLSGLSGGPDDSPSAEGGAADTSVDVAVTTMRPSDGGLDADAAVKPFCQSHPGHAVCVDFDEGSLPTDWMASASRGEAKLSTMRAASLPGAFSANIPRHDTGKYQAQLRKTFSGPFKHIILDFHLYVERPDFQSGDVNAGLIDIGCFSSTTNGGVTLSAGQSYLTMGTPGPDTQQDSALPWDTWVHMHFDFDPRGGRLDAELGPYHLAQSFPPTTDGDGPAMIVSIGIDGYNFPAPTYNAYYDNVTIDFP